MRLERLLPWVLMPNIAMAGGGGGGIVLGLIIFLPILVWGFIKLWKFWFQMIFGGLGRAQSQQGSSYPIVQPMEHGYQGLSLLRRTHPGQGQEVQALRL
ncbi:MAG: hypothetical protein LBE61_03845 [Burkholderiaceae bacterium]|jgi:hypothetical protein|nr:hypothetical protein [Burkholderiaceae bacterium]